ncbi:MAG: glycosyl hydrolase family 28 protein, partial [Eubacteriales bacterium]|nr:glycosyl hydrolase family 28 protein [Eubacteriales bacterium]
IQNSPMWILNPVRCKSVTVRGLNVRSHGPNNDGCDPESCNGVLIEENRFDTGDDCISLKSGRDREGREEGLACRNIVIRGNRFADGHGGIALGSEASGGICNVVARGNVFESKNLIYALRLKTNARRGGVMENIAFCDSEIPCVSGAAVHATMLYEDGRNGDWLPEFRNIRIENLRARGGRFGIYIEAFPEVPVTGLVLKDIEIEDTQNPLYAANWKSPEMRNVRINGREYPRPIMVRIGGVPYAGAVLSAIAEATGEALHFSWLLGARGRETEIGTGERITLQHVPAGELLCLRAVDANGRELKSIPYRVLPCAPNGAARPGASQGYAAARLRSRGILDDAPYEEGGEITRRRLCRLLLPLLGGGDCTDPPPDVEEDDPDFHAIRRALGAGAMALDGDGRMRPQRGITRQDMATVAMQCCGALLSNASTTMPTCADAQSISAAKGTNVARCLYYGLMRLDLDNRFRPNDWVTMGEAVTILSGAADRAGM